MTVTRLPVMDAEMMRMLADVPVIASRDQYALLPDGRVVFGGVRYKWDGSGWVES